MKAPVDAPRFLCRRVSSLRVPRVELARRCRLACAFTLGFAALATPDAGAASAGNVAASLDYFAVSGCPAVDHFEAVVESHLGYSPFRADVLRHVIVRASNGPTDR